jgi:hypothetical protein
MGYTHYIYRPKVLNKETFIKFSSDCKKILDYCNNELELRIGDGYGTPGSEPEITDKTVCFNGSEAQPKGVWTTNEDIRIPWPSPKASLVEADHDPGGDKTDGTWFAGDMVSQRVAPVNNETGYGSGSYETMEVERCLHPDSWQKADKNNTFCKTAYRPYDLAVTAVCIALKHWFPECEISTDGETKDWVDGRFLCNNLLGYGMDEQIG